MSNLPVGAIDPGSLVGSAGRITGYESAMNTAFPDVFVAIEGNTQYTSQQTPSIHFNTFSAFAQGAFTTFGYQNIAVGHPHQLNADNRRVVIIGNDVRAEEGVIDAIAIGKHGHVIDRSNSLQIGDGYVDADAATMSLMKGRVRLGAESTTSTVPLRVENGDSNWWQVELQPPENDGVGSDIHFLSKYGSRISFCEKFVPAVLNFTGQHRCVTRDADLAPGQLVSCTGDHIDLGGQAGVTMDEAVPVVTRTLVARDPAVFGVVSAVEGAGGKRTFAVGQMRFEHEKPDPENRRVIVNQVGEGSVLVNGLGGDIAPGDHLCASGVDGAAMKQGDTVLHSYTVAKSTTRAAFADPGETRVIGCTYT